MSVDAIFEPILEKNTRQALRPYIPEDSLAAFVAAEDVAYQAAAVKAIVLTPRTLLGIDLQWRVQRDPGGVPWRVDEVSVSHLPLREIVKAEIKYRSVVNVSADHFQSQPDECVIELTFSRDLGPFAKDLSLPLKDHAYDVDKDHLIKEHQTLLFADALAKVLGQSS
jgi:hypothetical protein